MTRPTRFLMYFTAAATLSLGLAACSQGTGEPTDEAVESAQAADPAAPAPKAREPHHRGKFGDPAKMIEKLDVNKNGTLEQSELPEHKRRFLEEADSDKNGSLSVAELEAHHKQMRERHRGHHDPAKMIEKLDVNKNGTLELSELPEHKRGFLEEADTDKSGSLTATELEAHRKQMGERHFARQDENKDGFLTEAEVGKRWSFLSVADADKDGKVSKAEIETAHKEGKLMPPGGPHRFHRGRGFGKDPAKLIEKFDANENGSLELSELPEHKRDKLGAADANKDQKLTLDELKAHFAAKMKAHGARFKQMDRDEQAL